MIRKRLVLVFLILMIIAFETTSTISYAQGIDIFNTPLESSKNQDSNYNKNVEFLKSINILDENNNFEMTKILSREEFYSIIEKISYYAITPDNSDGNISFLEVIENLVKLVGYDYRVSNTEKKEEYINIARNIGITTGISILNTQGETKFIDVVKMICNTLEIDIMKLVGVGSNNSYQSIKGNTLLTEKLKIYNDVGIVTANEFTGLNSEKGKTSNNMVRINTANYYVGKTKANNLIGKYIKYYYFNDEDIKLLMYVESINNDILAIPSDDFIMLKKSDNENAQVSYYNGSNREKNIKMSFDFKVIYNEQVLNIFDERDFDNVNGNFEIIDNNRDGLYDIIVISDYKTLIVDAVDKDNKIIYLMDNKTPIMLEKYEKWLMLKDETEMNIADLKKWNVLSVKEAINNHTIKIEVSIRSIKGEIQEKQKDENTIVKIGDEKFKTDKNLSKNLKVGDKGIFYLNIFGEISDVDSTNKLLNKYGYLIKAKLTEDLSQDLLLQISTMDAEVKVFKTAKNVKFNESTIEYKELYHKYFKNKEDAAIQQLITYNLNSEGKLVELNIADETPLPFLQYKKDKFTKNYDCKVPGGANKKLTYNLGFNYLSDEDVTYFLTEETPIFFVDITDTTADGVIFGNSKNFNSDKPYEVIVYDANEVSLSGAVVVLSAGKVSEVISYFDDAHLIARISKISKVVDNDEIVTQITCIKNGEEQVLKVSENVMWSENDKNNFQKRTHDWLGIDKKTFTIDNLSPGDIIFYVLDNKNKIKVFDVVFRANVVEKKNDKYKNIVQYPGYYSQFFGKVEVVYDKWIVLSDENGILRPYLVGDRPSFEFLNEAKTFTPFETTNITKGDELFCTMYANKIVSLTKY